MSPLPLVLSIQSHVAYGHVGNAAATLPLQLLGVQPLVVNTVQFSNHTGYGEFKGEVFSPAHIEDVLEGLNARGILDHCNAVLSGYLGDAGVGEVILNVVKRIRQANPGLCYLCDPVMGDVGRGIFVRPDIPPFLCEKAILEADIVTPNQFEFELLYGKPVGSLAETLRAARTLIARDRHAGPRLVVVTSLRTPDLPDDVLSTVAVTADEAWMVQTPFLALEPLPNGMGDAFAAILLGHLLNGASTPEAVSNAVSALYALISRTDRGSRDLPLITCREQITAPDERFAARPVDTAFTRRTGDRKTAP